MSQVAILNDAIRSAAKNTPLSRHGVVVDPSDRIIECLINAAEYFLFSRKLGHDIGDLMELHEMAVVLIESLKQNFPDRIGTKRSDGTPLGWGIRKGHDPLHKVLDRI